MCGASPELALRPQRGGPGVPDEPPITTCNDSRSPHCSAAQQGAPSTSAQQGAPSTSAQQGAPSTSAQQGAPSTSAQQGAPSETGPIRTVKSIYLLDVDAVQGLDLLGGGGGFGFVVSVTLKDRRHSAPGPGLGDQVSGTRSYQLSKRGRGAPADGALVGRHDDAALPVEDKHGVTLLQATRRREGGLSGPPQDRPRSPTGQDTHPHDRLRTFQPHRSCTTLGYMVDSLEVLVTMGTVERHRPTAPPLTVWLDPQATSRTTTLGTGITCPSLDFSMKMATRRAMSSQSNSMR
ncbi:hypothetical protein EYF80_060496 [Liparis tanakae]|uniref:Uncharacterized protein n=1 Tax=Liparis tanakae TaxID=230148 RepID=A0A4Z2ELP0_9TELE|nr:hypothetical protein EYF80_060496 [Liparis tanakae]